MKKCNTKEKTKANNTIKTIKNKNSINITMNGEDTTTYGQEYPVGTFKNKSNTYQIKG